MATSECAHHAAGNPHRTVIDWTFVRVRLVARWLKRRPSILIGDGGDACVHRGGECLSTQATLIPRLCLDARLFCLALAGDTGAARSHAQALAKLATRVEDAREQGTEVTISWFQGEIKTRR